MTTEKVQENTPLDALQQLAGVPASCQPLTEDEAQFLAAYRSVPAILQPALLAALRAFVQALPAFLFQDSTEGGLTDAG